MPQRAAHRWSWLLVVAAAGVAAFLLLRAVTPPSDGVPHEATVPRSDDVASPPPDGEPTLRGTSRVADAPPVPEKEPTDGEEDEAGLVVVGRVMTSDRSALRGVAASLAFETGPIDETATDAEGRFRLVAPRPPGGHYERALVLARDVSGGRVARAAFVVASDLPSPHDLGDLLLVGGGALTVEVRDSGAAPVAGAEVLVRRDGISLLEPLAHTETNAEGRARFDLLPREACRVYATAPGLGRAVDVTAVPRSDGSALVLTLAGARDVDVHVVEAGSGRPIPSAHLELWEDVVGPGWRDHLRYWPACSAEPTDDHGRTHLRGLSRDAAPVVVVSADGYPELGYRVRGGYRPPRIEPELTNVTIEVPAPRTIRWPLSAGDEPPPPDGTVVSLKVLPLSAGGASLPATARIESGQLVGDGFGPGYVQAVAEAPDGRLAVLYADVDASTGRPTSFRTGGSVEVVVETADGSPPTGYRVHLRDPTNRVLDGPVAVPEDGVLRFEGLAGRQVQVWVSDRPAWRSGWHVGTVDPSTRDARVTVRIQPERDLLVRVRMAGEPGLPAAVKAHLRTGTLRLVGEDPARGELRFTWRPAGDGTPTSVTLHAPGWRRAIRPLVAGAKGEIDEVEFDLERGGVLVVRFLLGEYKRATPVIQYWDDEKAEWWRGNVGTGRQRVDPEGVLRLEPVPPGRYRVVEAGSGVASDPVEVVEGGEATEVEMDLRRMGYVRGRVEVPDGYRVQDAVVRVEGRDVQPYWTVRRGGHSVHDNGLFSLLVPGDRELVLRPVHPVLVPAAASGTLAVTLPQEDVVLRLVEGSSVFLRLDPPPVWSEGRRQREGGPRVLLFAGAVTETPVHERRGSLDGNVLRLGGFPPGTWTLWIDADPLAPLVIPGARLREGATDLGAFATTKGSSVRIRILTKDTKDDAPAPRLTVSARHAGEPTYVRYVHSRGEKEVVLSGLGPGRFDLRVSSAVGSATRVPGASDLSGPIEVDGETDVERVLDLR